MKGVLFDGWEGIFGVVVSAPLVYAAIVAFIRVSGKRSTSQMNNFDWVVTVAIGSLMASGIVLDNISVIESLLAIALLLVLQYLLTKLIPKSALLKAAVKAQPRVLIRDGAYLKEAMRDERVTKDEIEAALREEGLTSVSQARWVILETDATFSVIPRKAETPDTEKDSIVPR